jgi:D-cysteine desulfhydrase
MPAEESNEIPLFRKYPQLKSIPYVKLAKFPTPVQRMDKVGAILGNPNIWIKRDDTCHPIYGGNKPRKYEFVMADALAKKKTHAITTGGIGSNHVVANTIFGKELGIESYIYLFNQPLTKHCHKNMLCDLYFGAHMFYTSNYVKTGLKMIWKMMTDRRAYLIMPGASTARGSIGFVNAAFELAEQIQRGELPEPDLLFVAIGSTGTCAGLTLGLILAGLKTKVMGISVTPKIVSKKSAVVGLAKKTLKMLRQIDPTMPDVSNQIEGRLEVSHDYFGGEYGRATYEGLEAIELAAKDEIHLDVTYTGKTFSGLVAYCKENPQAKSQNIIFWNTLNSVDLNPVADKVDYHQLPAEFHKFFDGTVPIDDTPVYARQQHSHQP